MGRKDDDPLFSNRRKRSFRGLITFLLVFLIVIIAVSLVNAFINRQVQTAKLSVTIPSLPSALQGYRILHISDLHGAGFGEGQEGIRSAIQNLKYDLVVLSGDMVGADGSFDGLMSLIDLFQNKVPVILVAGDEDPVPIQTTARVSNQVKAEYILAAEKRGAVYLDEPYALSVGRETLWLCPDDLYTTDQATTEHTLQYNLDMLDKLEDTEDNRAARRAIEYMLSRLERTRESLTRMKSSDIKILVTHIPYRDHQTAELQYQADDGLINNAKPVSLILAGHYNAGQCLIPWLGPVFLPASLGLSSADRWFPGPIKLSGLVTQRGVTQHISPGLGSASIYAPLSWRFFNSPTVTLLTLTNKLVSQ